MVGAGRGDCVVCDPQDDPGPHRREVGQPRWSSTTVSLSHSLAGRSIVLTKWHRCGLTTQAVRTTAWLGLALRTAEATLEPEQGERGP